MRHLKSRGLSFHSPSPEQTGLLGAVLAGLVMRLNPGALLLYAPLGAGKSALTAALVRALPGGEKAECSSPSFTVCNIYYTAPVTRHFDLYRLAPGLLNDDLAESLDDVAALTIVEWAENMAEADAPADGLACRICLDRERAEEGRIFDFAALGPRGREFLRLLREQLSQMAR